MASNYTEHCELNQWLAADQVVHTDFNADNAKLDTMLSARNCQIYMTSYQGKGEGVISLTFPHKPMIVIIMDGNLTWICGIQGAECMNLRYAQTSGGRLPVTWSGNTLSWDVYNENAYTSGNIPGQTYLVAALLDVDHERMKGHPRANARGCNIN